ncbi:putative neural-cadherin, partial [Penaeus vannamei]
MAGDVSLYHQTVEIRISYELGFKVNDASQGQTGVNANVTVKVTSLSQQVVSAATPLTLAADPYYVGASSILDRLVVAARAWVEGSSEGVQAVSVQKVDGPSAPSTRVWLTSPGVSNLDHVLLHRKDELEHTIGVSITDVGVGTCEEAAQEDLGCSEGCAAQASVTSGFSVVDANTSAVVGPWVGVHSGCGCARFAPADDTVCSADTCLNGGHCVPTPTGTRCICPHGTFGSRCKILSRHFEGGGPGGETGGRNQMEEDLGGWAWVPSIPSCAEVHLSLEVLTGSPDATLLYSGPDHLPPAQGANSDMLALELRGGRPSLLLDLGAGPAALSLNASYSLADSTWHRLDLIWKDELVEMIVDLCSGASIDGPPAKSSKSALNDSETPTSSPPIPPDAHTCRGAARLSRGALLLNAAQPLQVGGLAHPPPAHTVYGWPKPILARPLRGCVRNLRINGEHPPPPPPPHPHHPPTLPQQYPHPLRPPHVIFHSVCLLSVLSEAVFFVFQLIDLGHGLLGQKSSPGCKSADCLASGISCGVHGRCHGSPGYLRCECQPGWSGPDCATPSTPTAFQVNSYVKLALSFTPLAYTTTVHLRFRTWQRRGELVVLSSQHGRDRFAVQLDNGRLCLVLQLHPDPQRSLCLTRAQVTDGQWHTVSAS